MLNLQHHDRPSLLAGKLHAILQRSWPKGRDLFDLFGRENLLRLLDR
jgi:hypothetical protein